jgi:hypothetical protein
LHTVARLVPGTLLQTELNKAKCSFPFRDRASRQDAFDYTIEIGMIDVNRSLGLSWFSRQHLSTQPF